MTVDLIMPTLGKPHMVKALESLQHLPFAVKPNFITGGGGWPQAINIGLEHTRGDVLLMDDDVELTDSTFEWLGTSLWEAADIIGFKLLFPDDTIQHAGGFCFHGHLGHIGYGAQDSQFNEPMWVCHCTASLLYIKSHVLDKVGRAMAVWDGLQFEDVDFSFHALKAGFKILYAPGMAVHHESATKHSDPQFQQRMQMNYRRLTAEHLNDEWFVSQLAEFPKEAGHNEPGVKPKLAEAAHG